MTALIIVVFIVTLLAILLWISRPPIQKKTFKIVKAGNVTRITPLTIEMNNLFNKKYVSQGTTIDPNDYEIFIVDGNSMSRNLINNGDAVFVKKIYAGEKFEIKDYPVVLLEIDKEKDSTCDKVCQQPVEFKLRKFLGYIRLDTTFEEWFKEFSQLHIELKEDERFIKEKFNESVEKFKNNNANTENQSLTFSVSYEPESNKTVYSFHPIKFLYGKVEYVIGTDKIR